MTQPTCQHCQATITDDQDVVHLNGRCGHHLHLVCYDKRRAVGVSSCCCDGQSSDLGDVLEARLYNPLAPPAGSVDTASKDATTSTRTGLGGILDAIKSIDTFVDSRINQTAATAIRAGTSVKALLDTGIDATAIVKDPGNPLIADLTRNYTTAEIVGLGFTWDALLAVGLNIQTWDRKKWTVARLVEDLKLTADHLLQGLCAGQASALPSLDLSAVEWQTLCGERGCAVKFFQRGGLAASGFLEFKYDLDAWRYQLGLEQSPVTVFKLTPQQCWDWLDGSAVDKATVVQQFKFLFGADVPERPGFGDGVGDGLPSGGGAEAGLAPQRGVTASATTTARTGRGRGHTPLRTRGFGGNPFRRGSRPGFAHGLVPPARRGRGRGQQQQQQQQQEEGALKLEFVHLGEEDL